MKFDITDNSNETLEEQIKKKGITKDSHPRCMMIASACDDLIGAAMKAKKQGLITDGTVRLVKADVIKSLEKLI